MCILLYKFNSIFFINLTYVNHILYRYKTMNIQFLYVQKKDKAHVIEEYLFVIKYEDVIEDLNKQIYMILYDNNIPSININYFDKFYIKKGFIIPYDKLIWEDFIKFALNNLNLIQIIDCKTIEKIINTNILHFNYNTYASCINSIITNIIMNTTTNYNITLALK